MKVKEVSEKAGLKLSIKKTKIMASGPIISWCTDGETMATVTDFTFLGSKITVDGVSSHNNDKPRLHVKEQRHSFANKGPYSEIYVFVFFSSLVPMQVIP